MRSDRIVGLALTLALGLLGCETSPFRCAGRGSAASVGADLSATALSLAGDLDGDGLSDALVGAPALNRFTAMFGNTLRPPVVLTLLAPAGLHLGGALAGGFDAHADGLSDFVVGA